MKRVTLVRASRGMAMEVAMQARRAMRGATALVLCAALASSLDGCTAIGFAVGARADSRAGSGGPELLVQVKVGHPVTLFLRDGRRLDGRFSGWSRDSGGVASPGRGVPLRGDSVRLATSTGEVAVHAEEIASVLVSVNRGRVTGLLVGAALDAIAITAFVFGMEKSTEAAYGQ